MQKCKEIVGLTLLIIGVVFGIVIGLIPLKIEGEYSFCSVQLVYTWKLLPYILTSLLMLFLGWILVFALKD